MEKVDVAIGMAAAALLFKSNQTNVSTIIKPPSIITDPDVVLRAYFDDTLAGGSGSNTGLNTSRYGFAAPFSPPSGWGQQAVSKPYSRISARYRVDTTSNTDSTIQLNVYVRHGITWIYVPQLTMNLASSSVILPVEFDAGIVNVSDLPFGPAINTLTIGTDRLSLIRTTVIVGGAITIKGYVEILGYV